MADAPFRDRPLSAEEVRRIVERAAAFAKVDVAAGKSGRPLTLPELERYLRELGLGPDAVRRAMEGGAVEARAAQTAGSRITREVELEGALSPERFEEIAEVIAAVMGMEGQVSAIGHKLTWVPGGLRMEPALTVQVREGVTHIRYVETTVTPLHAKASFATLSAMAAFVGSTTSTLGGVGIAKALEIHAAPALVSVLSLAALLGAAAAIGSFAGLWRRFKRQKAQRAAFADEVVARVARAVRDRIEPTAPNVRVDAAGDEHEAEHVAPAAGRETRRR